MNWTMRLLVCFVLFLCLAENSESSANRTKAILWMKDKITGHCSSSHYKRTSKCEVSAYPPSKSKLVPTYVVNLDLPPEERWAKLASDKKKEILTLHSYIKNLTSIVFSGHIYSGIQVSFPYLFKTLPSPYKEEILGIATACNATVADMTLFNVFYEIFTLCTSIIAQDKNGQLFHGRNLDFGEFMGWDMEHHTWLMQEYLQGLTVKIEFHRHGKVLYKSITFAGYVGVLTGVKPNKFSLSVDERFALKGGYVGIMKWILGMRKQKWLGFLTREVMETAETYKQAQKLLAKTNLLAPVYFILGGKKAPEACVISRGLSWFKIWQLGTTSCEQNSTWYLLQTNHDPWNAEPFWDSRMIPGINCMDQLGVEGVGNKGLFNVLSTKPVLNKGTAYTSLMNVASGSLDAWLQECPDPCSPW